MLGLVAIAACGGEADPPAGESCQVDSYANPGVVAAVDVLIVVDESADMAAHQDALVENLRRFALVLDSVEGGLPSVRIAVVSADEARGGTYEGAPAGAACTGPAGPVIEDLSAHWWTCGADRAARCGERNFDGALADVLVCVGTRGADGAGARAPLAAIDRALSPGNPDRAAFLRDDALLAVYVIAAGDDESAGEVSAYADALRAAKQDPASILVGVVGDGPGPRLSAFAAAFPGRNDVEDIGAADWTDVMVALASTFARTLGFSCLPASTDATDCIAAEDRALQEPIPACALVDGRPDPATALPCWWVDAVDDPACPLQPFVERPTFDLHPAELRCAVSCELP